MRFTAYLHGRPPGGRRKLFLAMRLTAILLTVCCLHVAAKGVTQSVTFSGQHVPIPEVLETVKQQTGYFFFYKASDLEQLNPVTIHVTNYPLKDFLTLLFDKQPLEYTFQNKTVLIKRKPPTGSEGSRLFSPLVGAEPPINVRGTVKNENGEPIAGATVSVKGTDRATSTDENGNFVLNDIDSKATLVITGANIETFIINVKQKAIVNVTVMQKQTSLNEVVVNKGYYTEKQALSTGDVSIVTAKEIERQPVTNPLAALEGRVPGLVVSQNSGMPGGSFNVQIRGQNSIINGNDPFYVIDGVPYYSQIPGSVQGYGPLNYSLNGGNPLNFINPSDIESIEILKDADATAIYGSRAANGAILITTKKGKNGTTRFNINAYSGIGKVTHTMTLLNTQQYLEMRHEAFANDGATPDSTSDFDVTFWDTTRHTNWQKVLLGNQAHYDDIQASFSGGNANTQYLIGGGYHKETTPFPTLLPDQGADRKVSTHFSINNISADNKLKIFFTGSYMSDKNTVQSDFTSTAMSLPPNAPPLYNSDGTLNWAPLAPGQFGTWGNPLAQLMGEFNSVTSNLLGNGIFSYTVLPGLNIKASLGYTNTQTNEIQTQPTTARDPGSHPVSGSSNFNAVNTNSWIIEPQAEYKRQFGRGIFSALLGTTFHENNTSVQRLHATGFSSDAVLENIQAATSVSVQYSDNTQYNYNAVFGRLNYNWMDKYIVNFTARRDGSSRFGPGKQFANFGAIGAAWVFSKENFIQGENSILSFGKLRASYGTTGNDQIGDYAYLDLYVPTQYPYQGIQSFYPNNLFNPNLAWEINKKLEGGLELGFFKDRILITASYYRNRSGNQLVSSPVSAVTGFNSIPANLQALVQNSGQEYVLQTINLKSNNFSWTSSFNLSIPRNKLIAFPNLATSPYSQRFIIGQPITIQKAFHSIGVNDTTGLYQFLDFKGDPTYSPDYSKDNTAIINTAPKFYGGFQNSFKYKTITLDVFFQFVKQTGINIIGAYQNMPGTYGNEPAIYLNRWQEPGDIKPYQQFSQRYFSKPYNAWSNAISSNLIYSDASFIRLKNVSLSWEAPGTLRQKLHLQSCRIFMQGQNLLTITKYNGLDPETQNTSLPPMKVYTLGFQLGL